MDKRIVVGVGGLKVSGDPEKMLVTYALGSCVGVAAYDYKARVGGMLHFMLADSSISLERAAMRPGMFADTGMRALLRGLEARGASASRLRIVLAGGADTFRTVDLFRIGERNIEAIRRMLSAKRLRESGSDVGGHVCRTMALAIADGEVHIRVRGLEEVRS